MNDATELPMQTEPQPVLRHWPMAPSSAENNGEHDVNASESFGVWRDVTSRRQGEQGSAPRTWELRSESIVVTVTRRIDAAPDEWVLICHEAGIKHHVLGAKDIALAKTEAVVVVGARFRDLFHEADDLFTLARDAPCKECSP